MAAINLNDILIKHLNFTIPTVQFKNLQPEPLEQFWNYYIAARYLMDFLFLKNKNSVNHIHEKVVKVRISFLYMLRLYTIEFGSVLLVEQMMG